jgi:predicted acylesterase/phospholipase RssA/CRP-like cAMP-binding protein
MSNEILNALKANPIFTSLDRHALEKIQKKFKIVHLKKNKFLFRQGEFSDGMYLLVSGKLIAILRTDNNEEKILNEIIAGESIGEIGALSQEPRAASIKAMRDCELLKLSRESFSELSQEYPMIVTATINTLINRSRTLLELITNNAAHRKHIAVVPANHHISLQRFSERLMETAKDIEGVTIVSDYDPDFREKYHSHTASKKHIEDLEDNKEKIIYILSFEDGVLSKICYDKVDMFYIVGNNATKPYINPEELKKIRQQELPYKTKSDLIMLHDDGKHPPQGTIEWLKLEDFGLQHHIRINADKDFQRLLRFMMGTAVGVVLGGGGVRSWAHIGALRAIEEAGIPIDAIGGSSAGAIVAGYYALFGTYKDGNHGLHDLTSVTDKTVSWLCLTWPAASLFNGIAFTAQQKKLFGKHKIENMWLPYFCVSCNLSKSAPVIHTSGHLWKKIRASSSVPGVYPPVVMRGKLHLDGGIVNNLPVDSMKKFSPSIGTIIAVELIHNSKDEKYYNFPPSLPFWHTMLAKLKIIKTDYKFPHFVDMVLRAMLAGSSAKQIENALAADILISPDLSSFDLLHASKEQELKLIDIGYKAGVKAIKNMRRKAKHAHSENENNHKGKPSHEVDKKRKLSRNHSP